MKNFILTVFMSSFAVVCPLYGQTGAHRIGQVLVKGNGIAANVAPYASIKVCVAGTHCSTISPVYSDQSLTHVLPQPLTADASGNYSYYTPAGCVDEQIAAPGSSSLWLYNVCPSTGTVGTGSVNSVSVATVNGFQGTVTDPTSTPIINLNVDGTHYLPTTSDESNWNGKQAPLGFTPENTANKDAASGYAGLTSGTLLKTSEFPAFTGDATSTAGTTALTLATVNSGSGSCGDSTHVCAITTNPKGLVTAQTPTLLSAVTTLSVGDLSPLFTSAVANPTTTPAVTFTQSPAPINSVFAGAPSGSAVAPTFQTSPTFSAANLTNFPLATNSAFGVVKPDGTSITVSGGVISSTGGGVSSINTTTGPFTFTGSGVSCVTTTCTFSGTGTGIGSITWALPSWLTASPTTISASGTQTFSATTGLTANQFLATPNGSTGALSVRAIVAADIPTLNQSTTGNAATASALAATPTLCSTGQAPTGVLANGNATGCATISGSSGISGQTLGYVPLAGSATTLTSTSHLDDGITNVGKITSTEPIVAPLFQGTGTTPSAISLPAGTGSIPALPANSAGFAAPVTGGTAYLFKLPATITAGILHAATPGTVDGVNESALTSSLVSLTADVTGALPNANLANPSTTVNGVTCTLGSTCTITASVTFPWSCQPGLGDGLNAITAGTYLQTSCYNDTGQTVTLTGIKCYADAGTPTMNVTNGGGTALLTGAVTCSSTFAAGTQSGTTTIAAGDYLKFTFVASGTAKQATFVVTGTHP